MLEMKLTQSHSYDEAHYGYGNANVVEFNSGLSRYEVATFELFQSRQNQMFGDARIGARRFTWSDDSNGTNIHSTNFAGMNTARVVSTGSWSSPSEDFFTVTSDYGHAVASFDVINLAPADRVFLDGVRNGYAFIEDRDFGAVDNQINDTAKAGRPDSRNDAASGSAAEPRLNIQSQNQKQNETGTESARFGSEDFGIAHTQFTDPAHHDVMVAYYGGDFRG